MKLILKVTILLFIMSTSLVGQTDDCATAETDGYNMLLIGNSFFNPYAKEIDEMAIDAGFENHNSTIVIRGGENGRAINFWNDSLSVEHNQIKAALDQGDVEYFGMTSGHDSDNPIEGHKAWIEYALESNPNITIFISLAPFDFPEGDPNGDRPDWHTFALDNGFSSIQEFYDFYINEIIHHEVVDQLRIEFPSTKIFTIPTGWATFNLNQMNLDDELLDDISMFGPRETSIFTDQKGHQGDIIREAGGLIWLNSIYNVDLTTFDYETGFNTDLLVVAEDIMDRHDSDYKLCYEQNYLTNETNLDVEMSWNQEPDGWVYETFIKVPEDATPDEVYPVCIALHGNGGNGESMSNNIGNLLDCHIVVAPSGYLNSWNICGEQSDAPDVDFVNLLIEQLSSYENVDSDNIKILGSSNGAALTNRMFIENDQHNITQFVAIVSQMTVPQFHDGAFHSPSGETNNQSAFCGYDAVNSITIGRDYLSVCNKNDGVIPYDGGNSVGTSFIAAEESIFEVAKSQGYDNAQITSGTQIDNSDVFEFSYLDGKVVLLNGMAGHSTNAIQRDYIKTFLNDCEIIEDEEPMVSCDSTYSVIVEEGITYAEGLTHDGTSPTTIPKSLLLDVYYPDNDIENRPVYFFIHGGGFSGGSRQQEAIVDKAYYFASRGWVFVSIDYRLRGDLGSIFTGIVPQEWLDAAAGTMDPEAAGQLLAMYTAQRDAKAAMRWTMAHADTYNIDTDYITVGGGSAGAITAIALGISDPEVFRDEISLDEDPTLATTNLDQTYEIKSIVDFWGSNTALDVHEMIYGTHHFGADDPVLFIAHGTEDETVLYSEAEELVQLYDSIGVHVELNALVGRGHGVWGAILDGKSLSDLSFEFIVERQGLILDPNCDIGTHITETSDLNFNIFPNPAGTFININTNDKIDYEASLYDLNGRKVKTIVNNPKLISISLPTGIYLLEIKDINTEKRIIRKIVIM